MGPRTTYYSLAKERLKGKHPRVYNLILIIILLSLTGTSAFLISDILSFGLDYDDMSTQGSMSSLGAGRGNVSPAYWSENEKNRSAQKDAEPVDVQDSALNGNSSPGEDIGGQINSSNSSGTSSASSLSAGTINSAKKPGTIASSSKSHSSSGSSSSSRSRSSSEKKTDESANKGNATVPNNESINGTATNGTSIAQLPKNRSANLPIPIDSVTAKRQSIRSPAGVYRNESPQDLIDPDGGKDSDSGSERLKSETAAARMKTLADKEVPAKANNASKVNDAAKAGVQANAEMPTKVETPAEFETLCRGEDAGGDGS